MTRKTASILSPTFVSRIRRPGRYGDGRQSCGLSLLVRVAKSGRISKTWSQRIILNGKPTHRGVGSFPLVSLSEARQRCLENKRALMRGVDPFASSSVPTFAQALEATIDVQRPAWKGSAKTEASWRSTMRDYALPALARRRMDQIGPADVMAVLLPIWSTKNETARRVRRRIGAVCKWAVAQGYRTDNPAGEAISSALPKAAGAVQHHRALPHSEIAGVLATVEASGAWTGTMAAFRWLVLTACRSGEARAAKWTEVNREARTWTVPAERAKSNREHVIPLSDAAMAILVEAEKIRDKSGLLFPSIRGKQLSDNTLSKLLRDHGVAMVPHGARSSFRDWAGESGAAREVAEACLGHAVGDATERAYSRSDLLQRRRRLLSAWASYLTGQRGEVVQLRA